MCFNMWGARHALPLRNGMEWNGIANYNLRKSIKICVICVHKV